MEKFKLHSVETAPAGSKDVLKKVESQMKFLPNLYGIMANSPQIVTAYTEMGKLFGETSFSQLEKNIIWLTISRTNECHYCTAIHTMVGKMYNMPDEIINNIRDNKVVNDSKLEALRNFTALMVDKRGWATEHEIDEFLGAGYDQTQILELIVGIAQKTISNYVNHIANTPLDESVKPFAWKHSDALAN
jgi:uncharacterized peroxidase-related enzyme